MEAELSLAPNSATPAPAKLPVYIDDATSRLMHLRFVETESTLAYFAATQEATADRWRSTATYR